MRVIAGTARGIRLTAPAGMKTRPTADRVKEALFSIITSRYDLTGMRVLDLCAGSGALGIEALSRGAATACFVEQDRRAAIVIEKNLAACGFGTRSQLLALDALAGLRLLLRRGEAFDLVFFDPPYASGLYPPVLELLGSQPLTADSALVVAECSPRAPLEERYGKLVSDSRRVYGEVALEFFNREQS